MSELNQCQLSDIYCFLAGSTDNLISLVDFRSILSSYNVNINSVQESYDNTVKDIFIKLCSDKNQRKQWEKQESRESSLVRDIQVKRPDTSYDMVISGTQIKPIERPLTGQKQIDLPQVKKFMRDSILDFEHFKQVGQQRMNYNIDETIRVLISQIEIDVLNEQEEQKRFIEQMSVQEIENNTQEEIQEVKFTNAKEGSLKFASDEDRDDFQEEDIFNDRDEDGDQKLMNEIREIMREKEYKYEDELIQNEQ